MSSQLGFKEGNKGKGERGVGRCIKESSGCWLCELSSHLAVAMVNFT